MEHAAEEKKWGEAMRRRAERLFGEGEGQEFDEEFEGMYFFLYFQLDLNLFILLDLFLSAG